MAKTVFMLASAVATLLSISSDGSAQVLRGRFHKVKSAAVTSCGIPNYQYQSASPARSAEVIGYAIEQAIVEGPGLSPNVLQAAALRDPILTNSVLGGSELSPSDAITNSVKVGASVLTRPDSQPGVSRAVKTQNVLPTSTIPVAKQLTFRFPGQVILLDTGIGVIKLSGIGAVVNSQGEFELTGKLSHDGGRDSLLKSPSVKIRAELITSLSRQVTPPPDGVVFKTNENKYRAQRTAQSIRLGVTSSGDRISILRNLDNVSHVRIEMVYYPNF